MSCLAASYADCQCPAAQALRERQILPHMVVTWRIWNAIRHQPRPQRRPPCTTTCHTHMLLPNPTTPLPAPCLPEDRNSNRAGRRQQQSDQAAAESREAGALLSGSVPDLVWSGTCGSRLQRQRQGVGMHGSPSKQAPSFQDRSPILNRRGTCERGLPALGFPGQQGKRFRPHPSAPAGYREPAASDLSGSRSLASRGLTQPSLSSTCSSIGTASRTSGQTW